jgi:hypothetical protein
MNLLPSAPPAKRVLLFSLAYRHCGPVGPFSLLRHEVAEVFSAGARKGMGPMRRVNSMFRRLSQLVAIAAASLPEAGA